MKTAILFLTVLLLLPLSSIGQRRGGGSKPTTPTVTINSTITHGTCSNPNGSIDYTVNVSTGWTRATKVNVLQLMDNTGHPVYTQEGIGATGSIQNITPGAYYYEGSITVRNSAGYYVSVYVHIPVWIGIQTVWTEMVEMAATPNSYSAKRTGSTHTYGGARSANYLASGDGWIEMSAVFGGTSNSRVYLAIGSSSTVSSFDPNANVQYIEFYKTSSGNGIRVKYQTSGGSYTTYNLPANADDKIRLVRAGSSLRIQKSESASNIFILPVAYLGGLNIAVYAKQVNDGVKDVVSTMQCAYTLDGNWDSAKQSGKVDVDISSMIGLQGPFHYIINPEPIYDLSETYAFLRDSVFSDTVIIDSAQFFTGNSALSTHSFEGLTAGKHYVSVFDSQGNGIFGKALEVQPPLQFEAQSGLSIQGTKITATQSSGSGSLKIYAVNGETIEINVEVDKLNGSNEQFFGFANESATVSGYQNLQYGFKFVGGNLYIVEKGVLGTSPITIGSNRNLSVRIDNGEVRLRANDQDQLTTILPSEYSYKVGVGAASSQSMTMSLETPSPVSYPVRFYAGVNQHLTCDENLAQFNFGFAAWGIFSGSTANYSVTHSGTGQVIYSTGQGGVTASQVFNANTVGQSLEAGIYVISGTVSNGTYSLPFTEEVHLGYETNWSEYGPMYNLGTNTYSVTRNAVSPNVFAMARSANSMRYNQDGWIEFTIDGNALNGINYFRFTTTNINTQPSAGGHVGEPLFVFVKNASGFEQLFSHTPSNGWQNHGQVNIGGLMKLTFSATAVLPDYPNGTVTLSVNGTDVATIERTNASIISRVQSNKQNDGFRNVVSSFGCNPPSDIYGHLKYNIDGFYHIMKDGEIKFVFDQEYDAEDLKFNIYDRNDQLVKTQADFPALPTTYGDNYLTIDISNSGDCLNKDFYYLEVINSKKERLYLRFFNDFTVSPCTDQSGN